MIANKLLLALFAYTALLHLVSGASEILADVEDVKNTSFVIKLRSESEDGNASIGQIGSIVCQDFTENVQCPTKVNTTQTFNDSDGSVHVTLSNLEPGKAYEVLFRDVQLISEAGNLTQDVIIRQCTGKIYQITVSIDNQCPVDHSKKVCLTT